AELLFRFDLHRECSAAASHQCWMALSDNLFYILWIVICASDDDQIFEPASDEKFAILDETEIASPQKLFFFWGSHNSAKYSFRFLGVAPITFPDARTANPNLSYFPGRTYNSRSRINDGDLHFRKNRSAAHECLRLLFALGTLDAIFRQRRFRSLSINRKR